MANSLQELISRRAWLLAELKRVAEAIAAFSDQTPIKVVTRRNLRNTLWVSTDLNSAGDLIVFADAGLSSPAQPRDTGGWVINAAWKQFQVNHPELVGEYIWEEA